MEITKIASLRCAVGDDAPVRLAVAETDLATALCGTGFGYDAGRRAWQAEVLTHVLPRVRDIRRFGSAALDLCRVKGLASQLLVLRDDLGRDGLRVAVDETRLGQAHRRTSVSRLTPSASFHCTRRVI